MREGGLSSEFIDRVCILSAEDWEEFCMAGLTGSGLAASFDGWKESNWQSMNFEDWRSAVEGDRPLHPVVQDYLRAYWQELSSRLGIEPPDFGLSTQISKRVDDGGPGWTVGDNSRRPDGCDAGVMTGRCRGRRGILSGRLARRAEFPVFQGVRAARR